MGMGTRRWTAVLCGITLAAAALVAIDSRPAAAAVGSREDRQMSKPTPWAQYTGVTATQVNSYLSANSARLTDISVASSTPTFNVTMVRNDGAYQTGWWWYYGMTEAQVNSRASTNNARLIALDAYATSSGVRYAGI